MLFYAHNTLFSIALLLCAKVIIELWHDNDPNWKTLLAASVTFVVAALLH
jgi:hypothetical protein